MADYLSQAKQYLRQRLSAELSFQNNLEKLLDDYASKLVDIAYSANVRPDFFTFSYNKRIKEQVNTLIANLLYDITDYVDTLAVATHTKNKNKILTYLNRDITGGNFSSRIDNHVQTFKKEIEGIAVAGLLVGASKTNIKQSIKTYRQMPYQNPIFKKAIALNKGKAEVIVNKGLHLGVGISNSAYNSINTLGRYSIADAWMYDWYDGWNEKGAIGYNVMRGSSYPCSLCDSMVGFHTDNNLPPYHPSCCCIAIPVFK